MLWFDPIERRARSERFARLAGETHKWLCHNGLRCQSAEDGEESACYLQVVEYEQVELKMNVSSRKTQVPARGPGTAVQWCSS